MVIDCPFSKRSFPPDSILRASYLTLFSRRPYQSKFRVFRPKRSRESAQIAAIFGEFWRKVDLESCISAAEWPIYQRKTVSRKSVR